MSDDIDDLTINDEDMLWRRIKNDPNWVTEEDGGWRVSSVAFIDRHTGKVSVHLAKRTSQQAALKGLPDEGLVEIPARLPIHLEINVIYEPTDADKSHCVMYPITKGKARQLALAAEWLVKPLRIR